MIEIEFYETEDGKCPLEEYLDSLEPKLLAKTLRTIDLLEKQWNIFTRTIFRTFRGWNV